MTRASESLRRLENERKERWGELCKRASVEQDPDKFVAIIQELNEALEDKELLDKAKIFPAQTV